MDEKGFLLGVHNRAKVIVRHRRRPPIEKMDGSREWITVVECTCADSSMLPPLVIYKGKGLYCGWFTEVDDQNAKFAHSDKGYMTDKLAIEWLQAFDMATKERAQCQPRFLLMDGHRTHYSLKMIRYAVENNIIMISYPRHSTHLLQPLDVCLFSPLQRAYSKAVAEHLKKTRTGVTRPLFWGFFARARREAYTVQNIKAAWRKAGVVPYNPDNVLNQLPATTAPAATATTATLNPPINPKALAALKTPRSRHELRQHTLDATAFILRSGISSPLKKGLKNFISRLAHQTEIAWTRSELDKIELSDIRTTYAGKRVPKGQRKKLTTAVIADADYLSQKEKEAEEKEWVEEQRVREVAARKAARKQSASGAIGGGSQASASGGSRVGKSRGGVGRAVGGGRELGEAGSQRSELEPANIGK